MAHELTPAYLIHRRDYRESSQILDVFSASHGRLSLLARGVKKARSRRAMLLQPFKPLLLSWSGRGELPALVQLEEAGVTQTLTADALASAFYLNELLSKLLPRGEAFPQLFAQYIQSLSALGNHMQQPDMPIVLRYFEYKLLQALGLLPDWNVDEKDQPLQFEARYQYQPGRGFVQDIHADDAGLCGKEILEFIRDGRISLASKGLLRKMLHTELAQYVDMNNIKSRELLR